MGDKSFSVNNGPTIWIGNVNKKEVICSLIDTIAGVQQEFYPKSIEEHFRS